MKKKNGFKSSPDSLSTTRVSSKMDNVYGFTKQAFEGFISAKTEEKNVHVLVVFDSPSYYYPCFKLLYAVHMEHGASSQSYQPPRMLPRSLFLPILHVVMSFPFASSWSLITGEEPHLQELIQPNITTKNKKSFLFH